MSIRAIVVDNSEELLEKNYQNIKGDGGRRAMRQLRRSDCGDSICEGESGGYRISDVVMPDISGITLASKIYQLQDPPEVVLLSGIPGFSLEAWKIRAFGFIIKPYTRVQIVDMLNRYRCEREARKVL